MESLLQTGDLVIVNKLAYGPLIPQHLSDIAWLNIFTREKKSMESNNFQSLFGQNIRLAGYSKIKPNDILIYKLNRKFHVTKRCVGIPDDTIKMQNGHVIINNRQYLDPLTVRHDYRIKVTKRARVYQRLMSLDKNITVNLDSVPNSLVAGLSVPLYEKVKTFPDVIGLERLDNRRITENRFFVDDENLKWTMDSFGPIRVPKKGMKIYLNSANYSIYSGTIRKYENEKIELENGQVHINGQRADHYIFKHDYYFVLGDNRNVSDDSRVVGFIPEFNVVGKIQKILFSVNKNNFRWNRIFRGVGNQVKQH